ncbi:MAG TPA: PA2169 family four-helix-bundle protein [Bryobacteraceae bacterium]|nr:PA2169 family four-helix-bundle protein [Bryobacteraceae bacterium]
MATNTSDIRSTLNNLIETLKDGEEGFRTSAEKVKDSALRSQFMNFASQRQRFASDLQGMVARIGGEPETSGSASGAMHRGWMNLKAALAGNDDHAILEEAERGEDAAVKSYRDALSKDLPSDIRNTVEQQYREIQNAHTQVRALRDGSQITGTATGGTTRTY